ncbi:head maturation protease, ClpP-related [Paracoccus tibetensis]|jgi:ATP-dependent Clp protease, protease subunit|uniref:ATP-dependent Clp protease proteolytic subunit n=1 Tax=Paracoccus tibetensis TaxID=336292 RepID=A0A1G5BES5_9RHOB|nr:head maturation protease, ClpP-related [Paracoccus tibetensis]SCX88637.1 ATP-dependent protease ClpP, protease subunit [Paracoccus tibetensis]
MTLRAAPEIKAARPPQVQALEPSPQMLDKWQSNIRAADSDRANVISILDMIGEDYWSGEGVTAKRISAALRSIKSDEVIVDINSPGGDFFEGVAIYNLLRQDERRITVRVLGLAASAASVIAMAGDEVQIGRAGFLMVHNAWVVAVGNRHDMREAAATMEPFDAAMAAVYADKAGVDREKAAEWMDGETWFNGEDAVAAGLADSLLTADIEEREGAGTNALRRVDTILAKSNVSRSERRALLAEITGGMPGAAARVTPGADAELAALAQSMINTLRK